MAIFSRLKKKSREEEAEFRKNVNDLGLEKGDLKAMIISAMLVIFPVCAGILILFALLIVLLFT